MAKFDRRQIEIEWTRLASRVKEIDSELKSDEPFSVQIRFRRNLRNTSGLTVKPAKADNEHVLVFADGELRVLADESAHNGFVSSFDWEFIRQNPELFGGEIRGPDTWPKDVDRSSLYIERAGLLLRIGQINSARDVAIRVQAWVRIHTHKNVRNTMGLTTNPKRVPEYMVLVFEDDELTRPCNEQGHGGFISKEDWAFVLVNRDEFGDIEEVG